MTRFPRLSAREHEVLRYLARGLTYVQMARKMGVTTHTVDTYLRRIRAKTGVSTGAELIRLAISIESVEPAAPAPRVGPETPFPRQSPTSNPPG